jgi:Holliday junction resolvase
MSKMSRDKGKRGEREVAAIIRSHGFEARRGQQHRGGPDSPDVIHDIPDLYIEVKFREQLNIYTALDKASDEALLSQDVVVFHRRNRTGWIVSMDADDFLQMIKRGLRDA